MQILDTLTKLYNMYVDSATTANEKSVAYNKMKVLSRKHKVNLTDFIEAKDFDNTFAQRKAAKEAAAKKAAEAYEAKAYKATVKKRSRRSLIIEMLFQNVFSKDAICEVLREVYSMTNDKNNKKAVSGTMYDLSTNKNYFFRTCEIDSRIVTEKA